MFGEICFDTSMIGYEDVLVNPAYGNKIVTMTYPQVGGYGISHADQGDEKPAVAGMVVNSMCRTPSSWRCDISLPDYLDEQGIVAIEGVDTRSLTRHLREAGGLGAAISTRDLDPGSLLAKLTESRNIAGRGTASDKEGE